jgi:hypothetical protein
MLSFLPIMRWSHQLSSALILRLLTSLRKPALPLQLLCNFLANFLAKRSVGAVAATGI